MPEKSSMVPRIVMILAIKRSCQNQQGKKGRAFEHAEHFFAKTAQPVDGVLAGQLKGDRAQNHHQGEAMPAKGRVGSFLGDGNPT